MIFIGGGSHKKKSRIWTQKNNWKSLIDERCSHWSMSFHHIKRDPFALTWTIGRCREERKDEFLSGHNLASTSTAPCTDDNTALDPNHILLCTFAFKRHLQSVCHCMHTVQISVPIFVLSSDACCSTSTSRVLHTVAVRLLLALLSYSSTPLVLGTVLVESTLLPYVRLLRCA